MHEDEIEAEVQALYEELSAQARVRVSALVDAAGSSSHDMAVARVSFVEWVMGDDMSDVEFADLVDFLT